MKILLIILFMASTTITFAKDKAKCMLELNALLDTAHFMQEQPKRFDKLKYYHQNDLLSIDQRYHLEPIVKEFYQVNQYNPRITKIYRNQVSLKIFNREVILERLEDSADMFLIDGKYAWKYNHNLNDQENLDQLMGIFKKIDQNLEVKIVTAYGTIGALHVAACMMEDKLLNNNRAQPQFHDCLTLGLSWPMVDIALLYMSSVNMAEKK